MSPANALPGRPLATSEERAEHIGVAAGIPIFGLDAPTSAAYGPETAMSLLIPLGIAGIARLVLILSAILIVLMVAIKRHTRRVNGEAVEMSPINLTNMLQPLVVIPMARWDRMTEKALRFGLLLSKEIKVVNVIGAGAQTLDNVWEANVLRPIRAQGLHEPELVTLHSNIRPITNPLMDYILELVQQNPDRKITVLLPELVFRHWWEYFLHNQRVQLLKLLLMIKGRHRIIVVNIPWYL